MMTILKIAWRNILRNRRRSLITLSAIGFGLGALIFLRSFVDGVHQQMIDNQTSLITGHIQIHQKGFYQQPQLERNIQNAEEIVRMIGQYNKVKAVSSRIKATALVSSSESSAGVALLGVDPEREKEVGSLPRRIKTGAFLQSPPAESPGLQEIILGFKIAQNLNVSLDDKVVIMSQALDGSIASAAFMVRGLIDTGTDEIDQTIALITHQAAEELFVMSNRTSEVVVRLNSLDDVEFMTQRLRDDFFHQNLEVLPWQEVAPSFQQWIEFDNAFVWMIVIVVMIVVAIGILNTVLMGVLERTREFGILMAVGTQPREIIFMIGWEAILLGIVGSILGLMLGAALTSYFCYVGIDLTLFAKALNSFYVDSVVYPQMRLESLLISTFLVWITSLLASIYP
ncbi:MAG: ABC transporter permease, partial [Candidatus Omnitrophica bacterium]|nr:ABC transporter permease [Candidatus Omnitrophota bacterium]